MSPEFLNLLKRGMKMRHEEVSQILLSSQCAHDLGDGHLEKTLGFQTQRQEIRDTLISKAVYRPSPCSCIERS